MELSLSQTKLIGLTMKLDLKTREYNALCKKLNDLEKNNIELNNQKLYDLKQLFEKNLSEIEQLKSEIGQLQLNADILDKKIKNENNYEKYNPEKLFKKNNIKDTLNTELPTIQKKENLFNRIINNIKKLFIRK